MIMPQLSRKQHGWEYSTCAFHLGLQLAMSMVDWLDLILLGIGPFGLKLY
nr:hypothetical protein Iba_chr06cCG5180 [Ipomoea batatas]GMD09993.1 hypothetical protein Iba_chr06eCG1970 [Ipomoea batatas]